MLVYGKVLEITDNSEATTEFENSVINITEDEVVSEMYGIWINCYEDGIYIYTEPPAVNYIYTDYDEALDAAYQMAESECESLNDGCCELESYGINNDEDELSKGTIKVQYYKMEDEYDTTGETQLVTIYQIIRYIVDSKMED